MGYLYYITLNWVLDIYLFIHLFINLCLMANYFLYL